MFLNTLWSPTSHEINLHALEKAACHNHSREKLFPHNWIVMMMSRVAG